MALQQKDLILSETADLGDFDFVVKNLNAAHEDSPLWRLHPDSTTSSFSASTPPLSSSTSSTPLTLPDSVATASSSSSPSSTPSTTANPSILPPSPTFLSDYHKMSHMAMQGPDRPSAYAQELSAQLHVQRPSDGRMVQLVSCQPQYQADDLGLLVFCSILPALVFGTGLLAEVDLEYRAIIRGGGSGSRRSTTRECVQGSGKGLNGVGGGDVNVARDDEDEGSKYAAGGGVSFALALDIFGTTVEAVQELSSTSGAISSGSVDISRQLEDGWIGNPSGSVKEGAEETISNSEHISQTTELPSGVDNVEVENCLVSAITDPSEDENGATTASASTQSSADVPHGAANDIAAGCDKVCAEKVAQLKPALKGSSPRPSGLRVKWAADVYDPIPSLISHTVGRRNQRKIYSRRQRNEHAGKGKHGKGSKSSKSSKKSSKENVSEKVPTREAEKSPASCPAASSQDKLCESTGERANVQDVVKEDTETAVLEKDDSLEDDGWSIVVPKSHGRRSGVGAHSPSSSPPLASCSPPNKDFTLASIESLETTSITVLDAEECLPSSSKPDGVSLFVKVGSSGLEEDNQLFSPESTLENPVFTSREGSPELSSSPPASVNLLERAGTSVFIQEHQSDVKQRSSMHKSSSLLAKVSMERLAGATALAHGKVQEGRRLIFSAYMSARKHGMKGEVARCLRLIADTQTGQDRLSSLNAAVEGLAVAGVPFEHAEALLCLAQAEVQESISLSGFAYTSIDIVTSLEKLSYSLEAPQQNARLMKAKSHLRTAAGLLMTELSSSKYRSCSKSVMSQYNSPTGRRKSNSGSKKSKKPDLLEEERSTLSGLLGSVHELTGKVGILMQQLDDANAALHAAASNEDWRKGSREEAAQTVEVYTVRLLKRLRFTTARAAMLGNIAQRIQDAFFQSLEQAGCVSLDTYGPASSDEEYDEDDDEDGDEPRSAESAAMTPTGLVGFGSFLRNNPRTDKFKVDRFHHIEFWCGDATNTYGRFSWGLGLPLVAKSDQTTGNHKFCSFVLKAEDLALVFTAPYSEAAAITRTEPPGRKVGETGHSRNSRVPFPGFSPRAAREFSALHGLGVRAIGVRVEDVEAAYQTSVNNGAISICPPVTVTDIKPNGQGGSVTIAEVTLYGDTVLRFVNLKSFSGPFLPAFEAASNQVMSYGIFRVDHVVGNVPNLADVVRYVKGFSGFHEFTDSCASGNAGGEAGKGVGTGRGVGAGAAGFSTAAGAAGISGGAGAASAGAGNTAVTPKKKSGCPDVDPNGLGVNSTVLANDWETVILPIMEPSPGLPYKTQVETFLEHYNGAGVQHIALMCTDIVKAVKEMKARSEMGGFAFLPRPSVKYYRELAARVGSLISEEEMGEYEELGILVDVDAGGVLLQIFTAPIGDR
ncbi:unnamed protein product [Closterium sp. NIES-54]